MTEQELESLKERIKIGTYLLTYLKKCKQKVITFTRIVEACKYSDQEKKNTKILNEWLIKLDKARENFKNF